MSLRLVTLLDIQIVLMPAVGESEGNMLQMVNHVQGMHLQKVNGNRNDNSLLREMKDFRRIGSCIIRGDCMIDRIESCIKDRFFVKWLCE